MAHGLETILFPVSGSPFLLLSENIQKIKVKKLVESDKNDLGIFVL